MKANVIMLAVSVVAELAYAIYNLTQKTDEAHNAVVDFSRDVADAGLQSAAAEAKVRRFADQIERAGKNEKERNRAIAAFNKQFGQYMSHLLTEKSTAKDVANAYAEVVKNMRAKALLEAKQKGQKVVDQKYVESRILSNRFEELTKGTRNEVYDRDWLENFITNARKAGKTAKQVSKEIGLILGNMYESQIDNIWQRHRGDTNLDKVFVGKSSFKRNATVEEKQLHAAIRTVLQSYAADNAQKKLDYAYKGLDTTVGGPEAEEPAEITNTETDAERKKRIAEDRRAAAAARKEQNDQMREWRDQLKQKQDQANAFFENIDNYYDRQINAKMKEAVDMGLDESEQKLFIEPLRKKRNDVMEQAYLAVAGQRNTLNDLIKDMGLDLMEVTDETGVNLSESLLSAIEKTDITKLRSEMIDLAQKVGKPMQDVMADVFAKAAKSAQANLMLETQQQDARRKAIQEHDYTGVVQQNMYDTFNTMGYANPNATEVADKAAFDKRKANIIAMYENARKDIVALYKIDVSKEDGQGALLQLLFGDDPDGMGERIKEVLGNDAKEWQVFYSKLIQYSDEYTAAEKKNADERKKINDFLWNRQGFQAEQDNRRRAMQQVGSGVERFRKAGKGEDSVAPRSGEMGGSKFMDEFSYNANIEQSKLEIILIQEKIAWLQKLNATSEQVAELQKSLAEKQDSYILSLMQTMKQRTEAIYALYKPLEDFGTAAGQAFATMTEDAEAGRDAFKAAIGDMINSMMKQTVQMTQEYIKRRLMQKVNDKLVSAQIKKSTKEQISLEQGGADATSAITKAAGDAKVMLTEQVGQQVVNAVTTQTQTTTATAQSAAATDVSTQAAKTEANVGLGIAEGSAKTIGSLGWWGIPLIAVITAVLNGLLGFAMGKVSSLFGKGNESNTNTSTKNTKIVSGMLTYDSGNVQDLKPFVANDGSLYWATEDDKPHSGVSLLTQPTATTINGQPSLVAENGPELVIGRETTHAMMMNNPQLLKALVNYDRNYSGRSASRRAFDEGNVGATVGNLPSGASATDDLLTTNTASNMALMQAVNTLLQRLEQPIEAKIDMFGRDKLYDSMNKANRFMKGK